MNIIGVKWNKNLKRQDAVGLQRQRHAFWQCGVEAQLLCHTWHLAWVRDWLIQCLIYESIYRFVGLMIYWFIDSLISIAQTMDQDEVHRRRYQNSDTGYGSQWDTGLEAGLRQEHTRIHQRRGCTLHDHPDSSGWKASPTERCLFHREPRSVRCSAEDRRPRRRVSTLDCSVITRSSTTTTINKLDHKNQVRYERHLCLVAIWYDMNIFIHQENPVATKKKKRRKTNKLN